MSLGRRHGLYGLWPVWLWLFLSHFRPSHCDLSAVACTFEEDLCGWSSGSDQWLRGSGSTSASTGPSEAEEGDHYLYVNASSASYKDSQ